MAALSAPRTSAAGPLRLLIVIVCIGLVSPSVALAASEPASWPAHPAAASDGARLYVLSFTDQEITQVAGQVLGTVLQAPFDLDPAVKGPLTFHVEARLTRDQLLAAFQTALAARGATIVDRHGVLTVVPRVGPPALGLSARRRALRGQRDPESVSPALLDMKAPVQPEAEIASQPFVAHTGLRAPHPASTWAALLLAALAAPAAALLVPFLRRRGLAVGALTGPARLGDHGRSRSREAVLLRLSQAVDIPPETLMQARLAASRSGRPIEQTLNEMGVVCDEDLVQAYAAVTGCAIWRPDERPVTCDAAVLGMLSENPGRRGLLPIETRGRRLTLAVSDPLDDEGIARVAIETAHTVTILVGAPGDIRRAALNRWVA